MIIIENLPDLLEVSMPAYEYICDKCHQSFTRSISYEDYGREPVSCPHCGNSAVTRQIESVQITRSNSTRMQEFHELADVQKMGGVDENPEEIGKMMRKMSGEIGANMGPEFNEVVDRLESGQTTTEIEKELPDFPDSSGNEKSDSH